MVPALIAAALLATAAADTPGSMPVPAAAATAPAPAAKAKPKGSDTVCWDEEITGSHFPRRVCTTRDELAARQRQDQQALTQHAHAAPGTIGH